MKNFICLASIALLSCGMAVAQSTDSSSQSNSTQGNSTTQKTQRNTPVGDTRDAYGDIVAPDGSTTPRGTLSNSPHPHDPNTGDAKAGQHTQRPTPTGDSRDAYGDVVAPDGSTTPRGTLSNQPHQSDSVSNTNTGDAKAGQYTQRPVPPGDSRDAYGDTVAPDGSTTPRGTTSTLPSPDK